MLNTIVDPFLMQHTQGQEHDDDGESRPRSWSLRTLEGIKGPILRWNNGGGATNGASWQVDGQLNSVRGIARLPAATRQVFVCNPWSYHHFLATASLLQRCRLSDTITALPLSGVCRYSTADFQCTLQAFIHVITIQFWRECKQRATAPLPPVQTPTTFASCSMAKQSEWPAHKPKIQSRSRSWLRASSQSRRLSCPLRSLSTGMVGLCMYSSFCRLCFPRRFFTTSLCHLGLANQATILSQTCTNTRSVLSSRHTQGDLCGICGW